METFWEVYVEIRQTCPHYQRRLALAHNGYCTNLGCGKKLDAPVELRATVGRQLHLPFVAPRLRVM